MLGAGGARRRAVLPPRYRPAMRFHCCPPEKKGALATPKKGGTVGRNSGAGKGLRGSKGKAKSKNPMADVECEDEIKFIGSLQQQYPS